MDESLVYGKMLRVVRTQTGRELGRLNQNARIPADVQSEGGAMGAHVHPLRAQAFTHRVGRVGVQYSQFRSGGRGRFLECNTVRA